MRDLELQEKFELEVLDRLNASRLLKNLVFGGGTMLRLCYGLNRFSVDMDFWAGKNFNGVGFFGECRDVLARSYTLTDSADKFYTLLFEFRSRDYPRALKIEIRKGPKIFKAEPAIAYSRFSTGQVFLNAVSLYDMTHSKMEALIDRKEIRDAFDLEFLVKKGIIPDEPLQIKQKALKVIEGFTSKDYQVKLGSLLESAERKYYVKENFKILKQALLAGG